MCLSVFGHISEYMSMGAHICLHVQTNTFIHRYLVVVICPYAYDWVYVCEYTCMDAACDYIVCQYVCICELEGLHICMCMYVHMYACNLHMLTEIFTYMHNTRIDGYAYVHGYMCVHATLSMYVCVCMFYN